MSKLFASLAIVALIVLTPPMRAAAEPGRPAIVEVRSYNLKPGTRERFHDRFVREALPMLKRWKVDVVAYGPSLHDADSYFLMRAYTSLEERQRSEDAFYGSDEWKNGIRAAVLADIESYTTIVIPIEPAGLDALRRTGGGR
ncbi:MAG TPA: NIPSNAP family protein [Vicinamibacterales bacterium]|jgi:hypothetical protein|nr:NIPSNAP family protein [Vicinamibacterales bacterium]